MTRLRFTALLAAFLFAVSAAVVGSTAAEVHEIDVPGVEVEQPVVFAHPAECRLFISSNPAEVSGYCAHPGGFRMQVRAWCWVPWLGAWQYRTASSHGNNNLNRTIHNCPSPRSASVSGWH